MKNNFSNIKKILGFVGLLFLGLCSLPFLTLISSESEPKLTKTEQNIVWLQSSCIEAGYLSLGDADVKRIPVFKNMVDNAIDVNKKRLKEYEGRIGFKEWKEKGEQQAKNYSGMERGILIRNACN